MNILKKILISFILLSISIIELNAQENSVSVFVYHRFGEGKYPSTNIKISQFKSHIKEIKDNNYTVLTVDQIVDNLIQNKDFANKTIGLTIDDAFKSIYTKAWPILKKSELRFTIFVSTAAVNSNSNNYMNWEQIKELTNYGVTIGHHTKSHFHLPNKSKETLISEIEDANKDFLKHLGYVPNIFAYPYGEYSLEIKEVVKKYFKASFGQQSGSIYKEIDLFELPRYALNEQYGDMKRFKFASNSYGLKIKNILPENKVIKETNPPLLGFTLIENVDNLIKCYPSHNIKANLTKLSDKRIEVRFDKSFPQGRTRVNCPVNDKGKWRWTGFQFFNP